MTIPSLPPSPPPFPLPSAPSSSADRSVGDSEALHLRAWSAWHLGERVPLPRPLRIAVDFDGVLFDHVPFVLSAFRERHGVDLLAEGMRHWDFHRYEAVQAAGLRTSHVRALLRSIETDDRLHREALRDPRAGAVMGAWLAAGHEVHVVTARGPHAAGTTRRFLSHHAIPHTRLHVGAGVKTGYDILVDDAPHNVLAAAATGSLALLMDHPYNREVAADGNPRRVRDWDEVAAEVRRAVPWVRGPAATAAAGEAHVQSA